MTNSLPSSPDGRDNYIQITGSSVLTPFGSTQRMTVAEAVRRVMIRANVCYNTLRGYRNCCRAIEAEFGSCYAGEVPPDELVKFIHTLRRRNGNPLTASSKNYYLAVWRLVLTEAGVQKLAPARLPRGPRSRRLYTKDEITRMLIAISPHERGYVLGMTHLALLPHELNAVTPACFDVQGRRVLVPRPGATPRPKKVILGDRLSDDRTVVPGVPHSVWEMFRLFPFQRLARPWAAVRCDMKRAIGRIAHPMLMRMTAIANYAALYGLREAARTLRCNYSNLCVCDLSGITRADALAYFDFHNLGLDQGEANGPQPAGDTAKPKRFARGNKTITDAKPDPNLIPERA